MHHREFKCRQSSKTEKPIERYRVDNPIVYPTSSNGDASRELSWGIAGGSRSSRSNLSVRSDIGDETPWRKQKPLCMLQINGIILKLLEQLKIDS